MKICAFAVGYGPYYWLQSHIMQTSFKKFHPDIEVIVFDRHHEKYLLGSCDDTVHLGIRRLQLGLKLFEEFDSVILVGTDVFFCSRIDEFLSEMNTHDFVCTLDVKRPSPIDPTGGSYANADLIGITNRKGLLNWFEVSLEQFTNFSLPPHDVNDMEQGVLNYEILPSKKYSYIFPEKIYPISHNLRSRWDWEEMHLKNGEIRLSNNNIIKSFHWNGASGTSPLHKVTAGAWSEDVFNHLNSIASGGLELRDPVELYCCSERKNFDLGN